MRNRSNSSILQNVSASNAEPPSDDSANFLPPLVAIGCGIVIGNALVCALFCRYRSLRTITNTFVISLAVSDVMVAVVFLPTYLTGLPILPYIIAYILFAYLFNFCGITFDRYRAILRPLIYHSAMTRCTTYKILALVWSIPLLLAIIPLLWEFKTKEVKELMSRIYTGVLVFLVTVCAVFVSWAYVRIFGATRRQVKKMVEMSGMAVIGEGREHEEDSGRNFSRKLSYHIAVEIKAAKVFALVGLTFAICWLPLIIINIFEFSGNGDKIPSELLAISLFSLVINALVDPLIYSFYKSDFRRALKKFFNCDGKPRNSALSWKKSKFKSTTTSQTVGTSSLSPRSV